MQGFIEFFFKLRVRFFGRSNSKSGLFNLGTDCGFFSGIKEDFRSKESAFRADSNLNQIFAIRHLCVIFGADPKDEHLVNCSMHKLMLDFRVLMLAAG